MKSSRRKFIKKTMMAAAATAVYPLAGHALKCKSITSVLDAPKISLAQWSLHRSIRSGELDAKDFASIAKNDYGIDAIEFVNAFYQELANDEIFWREMADRSKNENVKNLLFMIDDEGFLGNPSNSDRKKAVENHYKWIHAAKILGCHSIRVNAFGHGNKDELRTALVDGLGQLSDYGSNEDINILIENHGLHTSDGKFITSIIDEVDNPHLGTLPDFGNWCLDTEWGSTQNNKCDNVYDRYNGVAEFLPYAKGVSAKSYAFDSNGNETIIDYKRLLRLVKASNFDGYIGIEFEGENMKEGVGIKATKNLIERVWKDLE